jgi:hypothetical protein
MDYKDLAKLLAEQKISGYSTEYFNKVDAVYECVVDNVLMTQNKKFENKVVFEVKVDSNDGSEGANLPGADCKIIYSLDPWNLEKVKMHLQGMLSVEFGSLEDDVQEQLLVEALEPCEEKDGKSALSGLRIRLVSSLRNTESRIAEGKGSFVNFKITRLNP